MMDLEKIYAATAIDDSSVQYDIGDVSLAGLEAVAKAARKEALEEAAKVCDSVNNYDNPMTAQDCAAAIRKLV